MELLQQKICEGDGLPDKICNECIQKLSGAYIFKQQCERSDQELRRGYIPPPGFSTTSSPNRQSSDSAFSTKTEISKPSSSCKITPESPTRKRSRESIDDASVSSQSHDYRHGVSKRFGELGSSLKRSKFMVNSDSYYEDNSASFHSAETDSDEMMDYKCKLCPKAFRTVKSLAAHIKVHKRKTVRADETPKDTDLDSTDQNVDNFDKSLNASNTTFENSKNMEDTIDMEDKLSCDVCHKTFKLKIMLKRHYELCGTPSQKTLTSGSRAIRRV